MAVSYSTFLVFTTLCYASIISSSKPDIINYHDVCGSIVPEATPALPEFTTIPFPPDQDGYYLGGDGMFDFFLDPNSSQYYYYSSNNRKVLLFQTHHIHGTDVVDIYKVDASLIIQPSSMSYYIPDVHYSYSHSSQVISTWSERGALSFQLQGFWSRSTGKLCMVGACSTYSQGGKTRNLNALLMLNDVKRGNNITSLVGGTLHSLNPADDSSYFAPISILMFPRMNYKYIQASKEVDSGCTGDTAPASSSLSLPLSQSICSKFSGGRNSYKLVYGSGCHSMKSCNPLGEGAEFFPGFVHFSIIHCWHDQPSLRFLLEFSNSSYFYLPFNPNTTFVAEGSWNPTKNQLCVVACRISNSTNSLSNSYIEDCSIRMSLRFPSVWSIRSTSAIVGYIWSNKRANESGFFKRIQFQSNKGEVIGIPGLKYNYTLVEIARKSCPHSQYPGNKGSHYPDANSNDMQFDMAVKNSSGKIVGWGYASLVFVDDHFPTRNVHFMNLTSSLPAKSLEDDNFQPSRPLHVSYKMDIPLFNLSSNQYTRSEISAEGIYYSETGGMCLVGCRDIDPNNDQIHTDDLMDCNIFVEVKFPSVDSSNYIQGHVKSTREKSDPLYLQPLSFSAVSFYVRHTKRSIQRMDLEIMMAMISNTLVCFFMGYQIVYVKKHPTVIPFISLFMLVLLILGHMVPLVVNFEALFVSRQSRQSFLRRTGGRLEANEVIVRILTMVAFLLQVKLLQLVRSVQLADKNRRTAWIAERKKALYVSLSVYITGSLIALSVNWRNYKFSDKANSTYSLWVDLRSYAGLLLDGFLLPQIVLNMMHNSRQNALSCFFYMGMSFVRLLPHAYDLFRAQYYADGFDWSYLFANHAADYYSTAWNVIISLGCLLLAAIIHLQQRNGGSCFLPKRFKELEGFEKVPMAIDPNIL